MLWAVELLQGSCHSKVFLSYLVNGRGKKFKNEKLQEK
jgi:hypothetical protein